MSDATIFTINARGNILLPSTRDHFQLSGERMNSEIWQMFRKTKEILSDKEIRYELLKGGLVPATKKREAAFLFDTRKVDSAIYGRACMASLLPLLDTDATNSILVGDLLDWNNGSASWILAQLKNELIPGNSFDFATHPSTIFAIYVSNLTDNRVPIIHEGLKPCGAYIGYVDTSFDCPMKWYLSTIMANVALKWGKVFVLAHEDDRHEHEDVNITMYPFEEYGHVVRSLPELYFGVSSHTKSSAPSSEHLSMIRTFR
jgi:hypothetical protein